MTPEEPAQGEEITPKQESPLGSRFRSDVEGLSELWSDLEFLSGEDARQKPEEGASSTDTADR